MDIERVKMTEKLKEVVFNAATGEVTERSLTAKEIAEREVMQAESEARQAEAEAKATARESALAKLAALGLTADEVAAL
jgi:DNA-binding NarL/FixJ family response regulator